MKESMLIKRILIVDDSGTARMIIRQCLEIAGFQEQQYFEAANGQKALEVLAAENIDLLLSDIKMPVMDGQELLRQVRERGDLSEMPVIMITSSSNEARTAELMGMGANAVLGKPISPAGFVKALKKLKLIS